MAQKKPSPINNSKKTPKYIFVVGGVMSSVGKGIATSSISMMLKGRGFSVTAIKADPYLNIDAGTMSPTEHGEVFVTEDGDEADQDLGNYERFLDENIYSINYMTLGRVFQSVLDKERSLAYKGKCVEFFHHTPLEIVDRIKKAQKKSKAEITVIEIGGTIGEYQNVLFLEAARMMHLKHPGDVLFVMVSYLPIPAKVGEMKTKPTQNAVRLLNNTGIQPDLIIGRSERPLDQKRKEKIAVSCNMQPGDIISAPDIDSIYEVPTNLKKEKFDERIIEKLQLQGSASDLKEWQQWLGRVKRAKKEVRIGIVGKYFGTGKFTLADSYISVIESLKFAAWSQGVKPVLEWVDSEQFEKDKKALKKLNELGGILVPGGFGARGTEGKIQAAKYARENGIPYFGLCLGLQIMTIEYARHVLKLRNASSEEFDEKTKYPVIHIIPEQKALIEKEDYGNTMRLGAYDCALVKGTKAYEAYLEAGWFKERGRAVISERHRHRYEVNNDYREQLEEAGLTIAGLNPQQDLVEILEIKDHPFMLGVQFHPEFKSRPLKPHPLFKAFIKASIKQQSKKQKTAKKK